MNHYKHTTSLSWRLR